MVLRTSFCLSLFLFIPFVTCQGELTAWSILEKRITVIFTYQSKAIDFGEWLELLTLCLAPLLAHVIAGVPSPVILHDSKPRWHDRIGHFNPTSILWRYLTILDRRVRAKIWLPLNMAASNANFWTDEGWDGSETMIWKSRRFCTRPPTKTRIDFFSGTAAKTLIVALQGIQAIYQLIMGMVEPEAKKYADLLAFQAIFNPLSIIGLFRLPVALWLTEDYAYANLNDASETPHGHRLDAIKYAAVPQHEKRPESTTTLALFEVSSIELSNAFHPANNWRGWLIPAAFSVPLVGLWGMTLFYITPLNGRLYTTTNFMVNFFYLVFLTGCISISSTYLWKGRKENTRSTVIPCVNSLWYKAYTLALIMAAVALMVVAALETRKTPCGRYTTSRRSHDDTLCPTLYANGYNDPTYSH
jgi:hypothetical protein